MKEITEEEFDRRMNNEGFRSIVFGFQQGMSGHGEEGHVIYVGKKYLLFNECNSPEYKKALDDINAEHMAFVTQEFAHGILVQW